MSSPHLTSHILLPYSQQLCRNRLVKAPIAEQLYTTDSRVTPQLVSLYTEWGKGGYGLIVTGAILVAPPTTQLQKEQYGAYPAISTDTLHQDGDLPGHFAKVARVAKARGALVVGQLTHLRREPTDPSPSRSSWKHDVICNYANAAVTLYRAGFDGIQLHAGTAHLLSQFLSSITNHRTDAYGGCLSNRARILFDVLREIRRIIPDRTFSISMKFDMTDIENGGITRDEMVELVRMLDSAGVDWIDISSYGSAHPTSHIRLLSHLKPCLPRIKTLLCATGSFRTSDDVSAALGGESVSLIGLGKVTIEHPRVGLRMLKG